MTENRSKFTVNGRSYCHSFPFFDTVDARIGRTLKLYITQEYDAWLEEPAKFRAVAEGKVKATDKRMLNTEVDGESWDILCDTFNVGRALQQKGIGITLNGPMTMTSLS